MAVMLAACLCAPSSAFAQTVVATRSGLSSAVGDIAATWVEGQVADVSLRTGNLAVQRVGGLGAAWKAQSGGLDSPYVITAGGEYALNADLKANSGLTVNAPGEDVVLRLNGHALSLACVGQTESATMLSITAARSVTIDGAGGSVNSAGDFAVWGISSSAQGCVVTIRDTTISLKPASVAQRSMDTHAIRVGGGALAMTNCTIDMDMGNQTLRGNGSIHLANKVPPSAVYITSSETSAELTGCTVRAVGTPSYSLDDLGDKASAGNMYALYARAATTVRGGSFTAESQRGNATCLYGNKLTIEAGSQVALQANAGQIASGVMSDVMSGVTLNAPLVFSVGKDYRGIAQVEATLRTSIANGFTFGSCAPSGTQRYSVLAMMSDDDLSSANAAGYSIGALASSLDAARQANVLAALSNALGYGCSPVAVGKVVQFAFDSSSADGALASVDDAVYYPTLASALAAQAQADGSTLKLLRDVDAIDVMSAKSGTIDLNGHVVGSLGYSTAGSGGAGLTVANGTITGSQVAGGGLASVYYASGHPLTLSGVDIDLLTTDKTSYGVYATAGAGALALRDSCSVDVTTSKFSNSVSAYGIYALSPSAMLEVGDSSVRANAASAGVAVYGISAIGPATVADSVVSVQGSTATTGALYGTASLNVRGSTLRAHATEANPSAYGFGIWCASEDPTVGASIDSCTVEVANDSDVTDCAYACLLGSQYASAPSVAAWSLSGENVFVAPRAGGMHIGYNVGSLVLADDFGLGAGSDESLFISQSKREGDVGMVIEGDPSAGDLARFASMFEALEGSCYEGWTLAPGADGDILVWRPSGDAAGEGVVEVHHGEESARYPSLASALSASSSGDILTLLADLPESGSVAITQDDLTLDLNGKKLTIRAGGDALEGDDGSGAGISYTGGGTLSVGNAGTLEVQVGLAAETAGASDVFYQGIAVSGGGVLDVADDVSIEVAYTGGTSAAATQIALSVCGVRMTNGSLALAGSLDVSGVQAKGRPGARAAYGVYATPAQGATAVVDANGAIRVSNDTATSSVRGSLYEEELASATGTTAHISGLREIHVDEASDAQFFGDLATRFRETAVYDDPDEPAGTSNFQLGLYYSLGMVLHREGAWYDGLRVWAFSDKVKHSDKGKMSAIVPAHVLVGSPVDIPPVAQGIATPSAVAGKAAVAVTGSVSAICPDGSAVALSAEAASGSDVSWRCDGARMDARSGNAVRLVSQGSFDLRDVVELAPAQGQRIAYSTLQPVSLVKYEPDQSRDVLVGDNVTFTFDGSTGFSAEGTDAAGIEVAPDASFAVGHAFMLSAGEVCPVANTAGYHTAGALFAKGASNAALFSDACGTFAPGVVSGGVAWERETGADIIEFKVGDAVVTRFIDPAGPIDLSLPSAFASRRSDVRNSEALVGWSPVDDEHATSGYLATSGTMTPTGSATYHAVYETGLASLCVRFTNIHDETGGLADDDAAGVTGGKLAVLARYGDTVSSAISAAGRSLPAPRDFTRDGVDYRFVGWFPYTDSVPTSSQVYGADRLGELAVSTAVNGVSSGTLTLRATYIAVRPGMHLVKFVVDGQVSACVVEDGARPAYTDANGDNAFSTLPTKLDFVTGKNFTFAGWFVDADGDGVPGGGEQLHTAMLPAAHADVQYTAGWSSEVARVSFAVVYALYDPETSTFTREARKTLTSEYGVSLQPAADTVAKVGSSFLFGGKIYTLLGWSVRKTDVEPLYDADNPLPAVTDADASLTSGNSKTYYGVYSVANHRVDVAFFDGEKSIATASNVLASRTSVDAAFKATGAKRPADKSPSAKFKGWAAIPDSAEALPGSSTMISSLVSASTTTLNLYAVYGSSSSSHRVLLCNEDGAETWYSVKVREGKTVASVFASLGKPTDEGTSFSNVPAKKNKFFAGWYTASGTFYSLDAEVSGDVSAYARYRDLAIETPDASLITAEAKPGVAFTALGVTEELDRLSLSLAHDRWAYPEIGKQVVKDSYTPLASYSMAYRARYVDGTEAFPDGDIGVIQAKVLVGTKYAGARIGVYWLAKSGALSEVCSSLGKSVDADGYVTVTLDNFMATEDGEGGNLVVAYRAAESGDAEIDDGAVKADAGTGGFPGSDRSVPAGGGDDDVSIDMEGSAAGGLGAIAIAQAGLADTAALAAPAALPDGAAVSGAFAQGGGLSSDGLDAGGTAYDEAGEESPFSDWDSNAVAFIVLVALAVCAALYGLWRLIVVRQKRNEAEAEAGLVSLGEKYSGGVTF